MEFLNDAELLAWQKTNRTHEECSGCKFEFVMPPKCTGHAAGETSCTYKADYESCYDCRIGAACTHDMPNNAIKGLPHKGRIKYMNNIEHKQDITKDAEGQSRLTDVLAALQKLATTWAAEGNFLTGADDHPQDKAVGYVYKECARELKALIGG